MVQFMAFFHSTSTNSDQVVNWKIAGKVHLKVHILRMYHCVIRLELQYLIGAEVLCMGKCGTCRNTAGSVWFGFR